MSKSRTQSKTEDLDDAQIIAALEDMLKVQESLMPGIRYIAVQDYRLVNEAPIRARQIIDRLKARRS